MNYPLIIAFEMSSYEDDALPVAVAWSLPSGEIKSSLISPEAEWLDQLYDQGLALDVDPQTLLHEGHSVKAVLEELLQDLADEPLYCIDPVQTEQALEKLFDSIDREYDMPIRPAAELLSQYTHQQRQDCRDDCLDLLTLDERLANDRVRLWLEMHARLHAGADAL